jgi:histidyl-tRNA synthetase
MKKADASGALFGVILGEAELAQGAAAVKALRAVAPEHPYATQQSVALTDLPARLAAAAAH